MGVAEELVEQARAGAPAGECAVAAEGDELELAVVLRPSVPMSHYMGIRPVCALGALDGLRPLRSDLALAWPGNVVVPGEDGRAERVVCSLDVHAGTGEAGMFVACSANVLLGWCEGASADALAHGVCSSMPGRQTSPPGAAPPVRWLPCCQTTSMPWRSWATRRTSSIPTAAWPRGERSRPSMSGAAPRCAWPMVASS